MINVQYQRFEGKPSTYKLVMFVSFSRSGRMLPFSLFPCKSLGNRKMKKSLQMLYSMWM